MSSCQNDKLELKKIGEQVFETDFVVGVKKYTPLITALSVPSQEGSLKSVAYEVNVFTI